MLGPVQNQDSYAQGVAAQRPFYFDHVAELSDTAMEEFGRLSGRHYDRAMGYRLDDAEYVIVGQGSVVSNAEAVADWLREERGLKIGVLDLVMFRPFPADLITRMLRGKKAVTVLERVDQPLAVDAPLLREIRAAMSKGKRVVYEPRAVATEPTTVYWREEFGRKVRIVLRGLTGWSLMRKRIRGFRRLQFWSHKMLRWMVGAAVVVAFVASAVPLSKPPPPTGARMRSSSSTSWISSNAAVPCPAMTAGSLDGCTSTRPSRSAISCAACARSAGSTSTTLAP